MCRTLSEPKLLVFSCTEFGDLNLKFRLILDISVFMSSLNFKLSRAENEKKNFNNLMARFKSPKAMTSFQNPEVLTRFQNAKAMTRFQVQYPTN